MILGLANVNLEVKQMDLKTSSYIESWRKKMYIKQPEGFLVKVKEDYERKLKKSVYGLK
jgi:hypothetical protein